MASSAFDQEKTSKGLYNFLIDNLQQFFQIFSVNGLRQFFLNVKEFPELFFYGTMARRSWFVWMGASPLLLVLLPLMALSLAGMAALDIYQLIRAPNKNLDKWFGTFIASLCTMLAGISISSLVLGKLMNFTFAAGPWFFLGSVAVFGTSTIVNLGLTLLRAWESPANSPQRMHYIQRFLSQMNMLLTAVSIVGCVSFVILFPVSPPLAAIFATACVLMTAINIAWRFMPESYRESLKNWVGLGKPEAEVLAENSLNSLQPLLGKTSKADNIDTNGSRHSSGHGQVAKSSGDGYNYRNGKRLFTAPDYSSQLINMSRQGQWEHMEASLKRYEDELLSKNNPPLRVQSKLSAVSAMREGLEAMKAGETPPRIEWNQYPRLNQSFFKDVGEMQALCDAYKKMEKSYLQTDEQGVSSLLN